VRNIEIKSPLPDRATVEGRLVELDAQLIWTRDQRDTFYRVERGWLKLREADGAEPELIAYQRATDTGDPRPSDYQRLPLADARAWHALLGHVHEQEGIVAKRRTLWRWRHTRIHLDRVEDLGDFLELETVLDGIDEPAGSAESETVIDALGLDRGLFVAVPYKILLEGRV
jgi:predicted adenylyl cyclase CyaB